MGIIKKYKAEVVAIKNPAENIYTVEFHSESGKFKYRAGQFLHLAIDKDYDGSGQWPESRCFSIQSNPDQDFLKITYSVKGSFTMLMASNLKLGSAVWLKMPYGNLFAQEHEKSETIFIAGGTGITPFISLFTDNSFAEYSNPKLYFGFRHKDHDFYDSELNQAKKINPSFKIAKINQQIDGIMDIDKIYSENKLDSTYFISGPSLMISEFKKRLFSKGISYNKIKVDEWE